MDLFTNIINEANYVLWTYVLVIMLLGCAIWFSVKTRFVQFRMLGENFMDLFTNIINEANYVLWTYVLVIMLLGCAIWFSVKTRFVQFRMLGEMIRLLGDSTAKINGHEKHISSFQAFAISLASRVGTGNLAGVATALTVGGPGAIFWMWIIALLGSSSAFVESTLAQLFKVKGKHSYVGGPAYYMERGLKKRWMGVLFAVLITVTFGLAFNSVQSNTMSAALQSAFSIEPLNSGIVISVLTLVIIFGGVHRIAAISSVIVPVMAVGYIALALFVVLANIDRIPAVVEQIVGNAFGWHQAVGGGIGTALMQGIKRGLFSNEAGMGSAPNAAATAHVTHPAKQGFIQALGVFTDTLLICSCTAFIILFGEDYVGSGGIGTALMQGIKRGLFSNEAGMGSAPNAAATAHVTHPAKQGFIQALGVFTDTLLICSCTAFIILFGEDYIGSGLDGIQLTQAALTSEVGDIGGIYVAIATLFFAYSSILGNYYYGEANIRFFTSRQWPVVLYRMLVGGMVLFGSLASLNLVWNLADVTMALMSICNLIAIFLLGKYAFRLLDDYLAQKRKGIKSPVFHKEQMKDIEQDLECW